MHGHTSVKFINFIEVTSKTQ